MDGVGHDNANGTGTSDAAHVEARRIWMESQGEVHAHSTVHEHMVNGVNGVRRMSLVTEENGDACDFGFRINTDASAVTSARTSTNQYSCCAGAGVEIAPGVNQVNEDESEALNYTRATQHEGVDIAPGEAPGGALHEPLETPPQEPLEALEVAQVPVKQLPVFKLMVCTLLIGFICGVLPFTYPYIIGSYYRVTGDVANGYLTSRARVARRCTDARRFATDSYRDKIESTRRWITAALDRTYSVYSRVVGHILRFVTWYRKTGQDFRVCVAKAYLGIQQRFARGCRCTLDFGTRVFGAVKNACLWFYNGGLTKFALRVVRRVKIHLVKKLVQTLQRTQHHVEYDNENDEIYVHPNEDEAEPKQQHQIIPYPEPHNRARALCIVIPEKLDFVRVVASKLIRTVHRAALTLQRTWSAIVFNIDRIANIN